MILAQGIDGYARTSEMFWRLRTRAGGGFLEADCRFLDSLADFFHGTVRDGIR